MACSGPGPRRRRRAAGMYSSLLLCAAAAPCCSAGSIAEFITGQAELSVLVKHLNSTGLMERLHEDPGPYTLFAPVDAAFRRWGPGEHLAIKQNPQRLADLLNYHVVVGTPVQTQYLPTTRATTVTTLTGLKLMLDVRWLGDQRMSTVSVNGNANVTVGNQGPFTNGFVHLIDGVLSYPGWLPDGDLIRVTGKQKTQQHLRVFHQFMQQNAELLGLLGKGPLTVFAPTDEAFARAGLCKRTKGSGVPHISVVKLDAVMPKDRDLVMRVLHYHIISGQLLTTAELQEGGKADTLDAPNGEPNSLAFQKVSGGIDLNLGGAKLDPSRVDNFGTNGVLHVIDNVLLPPGVELPDMSQSRKRYREHLLQESATPSPPEPSPVDFIDFSDPATKPMVERVAITEQQHAAIVVCTAVVVIALFALFHRFTTADMPGPTGPHDPAGKMPKRVPRRGRTFCCVLSVAGILVLPLFSATAWMLPSGMRVAAKDVRSALVSKVQKAAKKPRVVVEPPVLKGEKDELAELLASMNVTSPRIAAKFEKYGIDRIDLLAHATAADREKLRISVEEWVPLVQEARRRTPSWLPVDTPTPATPAPRLAGISEPQPFNIKFEEIAKSGPQPSTSTGMGSLFPRTPLRPVPKPVPKAPLTPPPTRPVVVRPPPTDPDADKPKQILGLLSLPFSGDETIECTLGNRHGKLEPREEGILDKVHLVSGGTMRELDSSARPGTVKKASRSARLVTATLIREPLSRVVATFQGAVGKPNEGTRFRCKGKLSSKMSQAGFTLDEYVRLNGPTRALCEAARNQHVKALADHPLDQPATQDTLDHAKQVLAKRLTTFLLHETMDKSMYMLRKELGTTFDTYVPCRPLKEEADVKLSQRATQVLSEENKLDIELFDHARHLWWTNWAGKYEDSFQEPSCEQSPLQCFDQHDKNQEKKLKVPFRKAASLMRGSTQKTIMCAGKCTYSRPK
eukprot:TRINITY_DN560_c2_g3_i1.p1 TRINITY_DN560_c2_g3~~TRINITY_DN560_c2_g3_i1.p1  ORF type:complete len:998 (+),score=335.53 TRINITY_DN560_c2_g3_i1:107-2995(+)